MSYVILPFNIGGKDIEEGFYQQTIDKNLFYLSRDGDDWRVQFVGDNEPTLITKSGPLIEATKVNPEDLLKRIEQEREFIESKLAELAKNHHNNI